MSVNSKMTAIADKIRAIRGVSGSMGLDSMATNLGTVQTNITNAYTTIGNKGGTVPSSKVSENLASAISSIPNGTVIQRTEGSFQIGNGDFVIVDVGFKPDSVMFYFEGYFNSASINFTEADNKVNGVYNGMIYVGGATPYFSADMYADRSEYGFGISAYMINYDMEYIEDFEPITLAYVALKYT